MQFSALEHCKKLVGEKSSLSNYCKMGGSLPSRKGGMSTPSTYWGTRCCKRQSPYSGCKGFIVRRQTLNMCGDFQGTLCCSVDCPYLLRKKVKMRKVFAHRVLHSLTEIWKWQRMERARMHFEQFEHEGEAFLRRVITMDETWIRLYTPELKRQSSEWRHTGSYF